ncbi:MAG: Uma2 family endonuclease [Oscillospiraceae bacterium]|nr:Uma2 family endonuclease [Oscillospiraceae bacterium]
MGNLAEEKKYTYGDYIKWDNEIRYELIDGAAYAMAGVSTAHQRISRKILTQFDIFLRGKTCEIFSAPFDVRLNSDTFDDIVVQPDLLVICDKSKLDSKSVSGAPDMVIEILSNSNTRHDTIVKFRLYQKAGVREYWIIDPGTKSVQVYILKNKKYGIGSIYREDDVVPVHILDGFQINLADVFYDIVESDADESETLIKQKISEVFKEAGASDEQIKKAIDLWSRK